MNPMLGAIDASITGLVSDVSSFLTATILPVGIIALTAFIAFRLIRKYVR